MDPVVFGARGLLAQAPAALDGALLGDVFGSELASKPEMTKHLDPDEAQRLMTTRSAITSTITNSITLENIIKGLPIIIIKLKRRDQNAASKRPNLRGKLLDAGQSGGVAETIVGEDVGGLHLDTGLASEAVSGGPRRRRQMSTRCTPSLASPFLIMFLIIGTLNN